jgi:hypothetical protein
MPRIRSIKPDFWDSPDTAKADLRIRLLYIAMWNWADDYGIGDATPGRVINFAFPNDEISAADYPTLLTDVSRNFAVVFFEFGGRPYYVIPAWDTHQRTEKKAKPKDGLLEAAQNAIAADQGDDLDSPTISADLPSLEREREREREREVTDMPRKRGTRLDPKWMPDQSTVDAIKDETQATKDELSYQHRKFVDYWTDKTGQAATKLSWDGTWRNWMRTAYERGDIGKRTTTNGKPHKLRALADLAAEVRDMETTKGRAIEA